LLESWGTAGLAAWEWKLHLGDAWTCAPLYRTAVIADSVADPKANGFRLTVREEEEGIVLIDEEHPLRGTPVEREEVEVWKPDWSAMALQLANAIGFEMRVAGGNEVVRKIGIYRCAGAAPRDVYFYVPGFFPRVIPAEVIRLSDCILVVPGVRTASEELRLIAESRRVLVHFPDGPTTLLREKIKRHARASGESAPILDVRPAWTWDKLTIESDSDRFTASYGREKRVHRFTPDNKKGTARYAEVLLSMAKDGEWIYAGGRKRQADQRLLNRLKFLLKELIPIDGEPFAQDGDKITPNFKLTLAKDILEGFREPDV